MVTLVKAVQTAMACPSQWDAWDADGNYYYLRYRSGCGSITRFDGPIDEFAPGMWGDHRREVIASFQYGHPLDGSMTLEEFAVHANITLAPSIERTAFWRNVREKLIEDFAGDAVALDRIDRVLGDVELDKE